MSLSDRVRPDVEAGPWVVKEIIKLEAALTEAKASNVILQAKLAEALRDAERYRAFRQLVKDDHVLAQGMVWNAHPSRKKFDKFVDFERGEKK